MKLVNPSVEIIQETNPLKRIELCGRVCYKSEDRITYDSALRFVKMLIERGHTSALEHARVVLRKEKDFPLLYGCNMPYGFYDRTRNVGPLVKAINARDFIYFGGEVETLARLHNDDCYMTVRFVCDRGIANELVRHRVFSFSQESTRYVNYKEGVAFIRPLPFVWAERDMRNPIGDTFTYTCEYAERSYIRMIEAGATPQEARTVLPLSTKTELIMTGTFSHWEEMLKLRLDKAAHPQMRYLMQLLVDHEQFPNKISVPEFARFK